MCVGRPPILAARFSYARLLILSFSIEVAFNNTPLIMYI